MNDIELRKLLMKIGISSNMQGYHYIIEAVNIINEKKIHTNMSTIYEMLAKKYDNTYYAVERSIRQAKEKAYRNSKILKQIYQSIPENASFLYDLVFNFDIFNELIIEEN